MKNVVLFVACAGLGVSSAAMASDQPGAAPNQWLQEASGGTNGTNDAGQLLLTANITRGAGPLNRITGQLVRTDDVDMYCINITDVMAFTATVAGGGAGDTNLWLFDPQGVALAYNNNDPVLGGTGSRLTGAFVPAPGRYFLAVSRNDGGFYTSNALDAGASNIFDTMMTNVEIGPIVPGTVLSSWAVYGGFGQLFNYNYDIVLEGAGFHAIPAPGSLVLAGLGMLGLARRRR